jgi:hypothetical protein
VKHISKELALDQSSRHSFTQARKGSTTSASSSVNNTKIFFAKLFEFVVSKSDGEREGENRRTKKKRRKERRGR